MPENRIDVRIFQSTDLYQLLCAARQGVLAVLEDQLDSAREVFSVSAKQLRSTEQHRYMHVMPAGVHHARFLAAVRQSGLLCDRQRVNICTQCHTSARSLAAMDQSDDRRRYRGLDLVHTELRELFPDQL